MSYPNQQEYVAILRSLDAAANRASEGLRVVEDGLRFAMDDAHLTELCKNIRHEVSVVLHRVSWDERLAARETQADVGTRLTTPQEGVRSSLGDVLTANLLRVQEAFRSLEEYGKVLDPGMATQLEQLRYRTYTLHRAITITLRNNERLTEARLYVLLDGRESVAAFESLVQTLVTSEVDVIQLRDKRMPDRELLDRARRLRELTRGSSTLFIMNDRPDLAALSQADGVHVGQDELSVKEARAIVGPNALIGVSTHTLEQARQAVLDGADYIGCGPTFPSGTKTFEHFPGTEFLKAVASEIRLPAFAIGGITVENIESVRQAGCGRVAVSGAIIAAAEVAVAIRNMKAALMTEK